MISRYAFFLLLLNVITSQATKDTIVTDLTVETTISAANTIDSSKSLDQVIVLTLIIPREGSRYAWVKRPP